MREPTSEQHEWAGDVPCDTPCTEYVKTRRERDDLRAERRAWEYLRGCARLVTASWASGDLAGAVRELALALDEVDRAAGRPDDDPLGGAS